MLAGGFILGLGGFFLLLGATSGGSPYAGVGSTRARFVSMNAEPDLALIEWGGSMKYFVLGVIFMNVIFGPWGLAESSNWKDLLFAEATLFLKFIVLDALIVWIESSVGKLRLLRISEYLGAAGGFAVMVLILQIAVFA